MVKYESGKGERFMSTTPILLLYSLKVETEENLGAWLDQNKEALDNWDKKMLDK